MFVVVFFRQVYIVEKIKTNIQNSTRPNQWAAENIINELTTCFHEFFVTTNLRIFRETEFIYLLLM